VNRVFIDTNVILDLLLDRKPHSDDITNLIELATEQGIELCISSVTITDVNYIVGKFEGTNAANKKTKQILELVTVENVGQTTVLKASKSGFKDFEDGVQNFCAEESKHKVIVTRNTKDFRKSKLSIMTPKEFITRMEASH
jgi:predicted nucleic acid-binding protein